MPPAGGKAGLGATGRPPDSSAPGGAKEPIAAALDVFGREPPPEDRPLFALPNAILRPHNAGRSKQAAIRVAISTARNALAGIDGKLDPSMLVNREVL